jgi:hypothetical protein
MTLITRCLFQTHLTIKQTKQLNTTIHTHATLKTIAG